LSEKVLRNLASRAATDAGFLKQARRDLEGTLAMFDYDLTLEELRLVEDLRYRTAGMSDEQLAVRLLVASEGVPVPRRPDLPPRVGEVRARGNRHAPEIDGGEGV
jgi:hypothetical protein